MELDPTRSIPAFYAGRSIFITGGSGFMGKILIEKLLWSCPDVKEIFLLMRPKKGMSIDDRLRKILASPVFDRLREKNSSIFKKLIPVTGDVSDEGLGLPTIERRVLIERVSIIFHAAASVRFDDPLKRAVLLNTRGTREVCILAASMKKLVVLVYVSTMYGNTNRPVIDEMLYPPHADWKETVKIAETLDDHTLNILTAKYVGSLPNTYTFTKQLAEHVINDYAGIIPSVIFRPSVVVSSLLEPIPGWIDNFNGPVGMLIGGGKGILKAVYGNPDTMTDYIPVDVAIKAMLVTAWRRGITTITKDPSIPIYNCASAGMKPITTRDVVGMGLQLVEEMPFSNILWVPSTTIYTTKFVYYLNFLILQLFPALVIDCMLRLNGAKPRLVTLQRKIYTANFALQYFMRTNWKFKNNKILGVLAELPEINNADFAFNFAEYDIKEFFKSCTMGGKQFLLKEDMSKLDEAKAHYKRMWWIDRALKVWLGVFVIWAVIASGTIGYLSCSLTSVFSSMLTI